MGLYSIILLKVRLGRTILMRFRARNVKQRKIYFFLIIMRKKKKKLYLILAGPSNGRTIKTNDLQLEYERKTNTRAEHNNNK